MTPSVASRSVDISKALAIGGWMSERELTWLATRAKYHNKIVEFGSHHGRSTRALADNTDGTVWAVDPWGGKLKYDDGKVLEDINTYVYPYFLNNLSEHVESGRVIPVRGFSYSFNLDFKVDMIFIDSDHRYKNVIRDIEKAMSLLEQGGLICGHDYDHPEWPGVKRAVDELFGKVDVEGTIWHTVKS